MNFLNQADMAISIHLIANPYLFCKKVDCFRWWKPHHRSKTFPKRRYNDHVLLWIFHFPILLVALRAIVSRLNFWRSWATKKFFQVCLSLNCPSEFNVLISLFPVLLFFNRMWVKFSWCNPPNKLKLSRLCLEQLF